MPLNDVRSLVSSEDHLTQRLLKIATLLSSEKDIHRLFEIILEAAMAVTGADGGTVYRLTEDRRLQFEVMHTRSKAVHLGGKSGRPINFPPLDLLGADGSPELSKVVCYSVNKLESVNIPDAYNALGFDFSGTRAFDQANGYRSTSFLTIPMKTLDDEVIGALQLINATDSATGKVVPFSSAQQEIVEALASQLAVSLNNRLLIDRLEILFESMISLINKAIDDKSPYTGGHCSRVPVLTLMLAEAANQCPVGPMADFTITDADRKELRIASLLHDCGKISTPVHVVDKSTKLETINDRIALVRMRGEIIRREILLARAESRLSPDAATAALDRLSDDLAFIEHTNIGGEFMNDSAVQRVRDIASHYRWKDAKDIAHSLITDDEVANLTIRAGTLTAEERQIINRHIDMTIVMLEQLPWPRHLKNGPEYAGGHHERMDGKGYPRGLTRDQMSIPARCMGIADVFEALTAADRPYKKGKTLSETFQILGKMKMTGHIDPDLFDVFVWSGVYKDYARQFLHPDQIDDLDLTSIPGYVPPPPGFISPQSSAEQTQTAQAG